MKNYQGLRTDDGAIVLVDGRPLPARHDIRNHSPTGLEWGYGGSGPAQLALALLADCLGDEEAEQWYQQFKWAVVALLPYESWSRTEAEIRAAVEEIKHKAAKELLA